MPRNKLQFSSEQVGKPSKAEAATAREQDAILRKFNDGLRFWQMCERPVCRRRHRCSDDVHACIKRHWAAMPEEEKEYWRGAFKAGKTTRSVEAMDRAGTAACDDYLKHQAEIEVSPAAKQQAQPTREPQPDPDVRVRRL